MNTRFHVWWLARGAVTRKLMKFGLSIVAIIGLLLFLNFNLHGERSAERGLKTRITVGQPHPWIQIEKVGAPSVTTNTAGGTTTISMRAESFVNVFSSSFIAGMLALYSFVLLSRIGRIEKWDRQGKIQGLEN